MHWSTEGYCSLVKWTLWQAQFTQMPFIRVLLPKSLTTVRILFVDSKTELFRRVT